MKKKIISLSLFILWMGIIFFFSHQNATRSSGVSSGILNMVETITHIPLNNDWFSFMIRKLAHFTEYAILGILACNVLKEYQKFPIFKKDYFEILGLILFCFFYACTDEFHQLFIQGRSGQFLDVLLDTCGSIFGIFLFLFLFKRMAKSRIK